MENIFRGLRTRLSEERKRHKWSQQELADRIGTTQNNVSRWELGITTPSPYYRTKLCALFGKEASELGLLPPETHDNAVLSQQREKDASQAVQPGEAAAREVAAETSCFWFVPYRRNPWFTGQEAVLAYLAQTLPHAAGSLALCGMGGIGKTQIALEYAYRHALEYSAIFWIGAETSESIVSALLSIAGVLQLPERSDRDQQRVITAVQRWLSTHSQWLLIWDNVEDLLLFDRFLPTTRAGTILLTTRQQALGIFARGLDLLPLEQEEGLLFLLRRARVLDPEATKQQAEELAVSVPGEYAAAVNLVAAMGGLPLALDQAGAYIDETKCNLAGYLRRYEQQRYQLLDRRGALSTDHPHSVVTTLWLGCQRIAQQHPGALELLRFCAFVAPDAIPEEMLCADVSHLGPALSTVVADPSQLDQAIAVLRSLSLVQRRPETETISLHRLVQIILRERMSEQERAAATQRVVHTLNALFPEVASESTAEVWRQCERLLPHVLAALNALANPLKDPVLVKLLEKTATYLRERVQYEQAEPLYERALRLGEQIWGPGYPDLAHVLTGLAHLYQEQGKFDQAEPLYEQALRLWEKELGPEHPLLAHPLTGLATLYEKQGKSAQAEPLFQRALCIREQALGPQHPLLAHSLNGLAILYRKQGKDEQAEPLLQRALQIREGALGPAHPLVSRPLYNLAHLYQEQGKYEQAEPLLLRSLKIEEQAWGPEHPDLAYPLIGLADLYQKQGKDEKAGPLLQRALRLWEQTLGPEHVLVSYPLYNLALLAQRQGAYAQADVFFQRALHITEQVLGPDHPDVALLLNSLADLYAEQRKDEQAELLYQRALRMREQVLRPGHPDLASSLGGLANLYREQGKYAEAAVLYQRALSIREEHLGQYHPETAQTLHDLAIFWQKQSNPDKALPLAHRALHIRSQSLGDAHPKTSATRALCMELVQSQRKNHN